ncbi:hypothetical protein ILYODFUR_028387 [Ilyodon furcidens]|uniref:Uncharacterized protein n=1 Tax=Ilyodon furcidens TaxID=33524 RepID=A0ABV0TYE5_9TELE
MIVPHYNKCRAVKMHFCHTFQNIKEILTSDKYILIENSFEMKILFIKDKKLSKPLRPYVKHALLLKSWDDCDKTTKAELHFPLTPRPDYCQTFRIKKPLK